ncbi:MAG: pyridoxamine 5'-phosphate oxidase family protein [Sphaerochaeta sp.]|jgi:hypothetical protein|uniref:pyridoxamine 5'-phosphate oxidase family protein n=1 Tax=Sphaerochaeta sp. S2 TaxID=2798868 RepID=UPI0018E93EDF|nr:pyridoxamine 5'-phosphate oxidase family protein [Sphaerochaeta sp. S2]MCK9348749.1 pyridoxamine 5'-phosphate oxidase family protein [Sphaerochaeta sp.]MBJ2356928.1 pyridoxamine 5'-phosphate oxidase family protein [Sphaerochaeta sp. S2]MDD4301367.1 pyridoxamine 5'-phosphate oxidase family protein [Sphaerochaeta sp.]MDD4646865.1 pyridoxamine 5'-phosphate oxidase family protein [Sphaerochaeta sp.]MDY0244080.1 pyridoxamine 5'-phosphate oxidase family protein [Sphaerochaeta sp.]
MFRAMRRAKQQLNDEETMAILEAGSYGTLACLGDDAYPYAIPLNYVYLDNRLYMHSAKQGHKVDAIANHKKVSFTVVGQDRIVSKEYTTYFSSVIAFGKARLAEGDEYTRAFTALTDKYASDRPKQERIEQIRGCSQAIIIAIDIDHLSGKQAKELSQK